MSEQGEQTEGQPRRTLEELLARQPRHGDDPLLTPAQAAKRIGVSVSSVRRWMQEGAISYECIGPKRKKLRTSVVEALSPRST